MNKNSNLYTFIYSSVMVILVAAALAFTNGALKERQAKNGDIDKMSQILRSVKIEADASNAEDLYNATINNVYLIDHAGAILEGDPRAAFAVDIAKEVGKDVSERRLPVYEAVVDGDRKYILPVYGAGLWGPIWGYIALNADKKTVFAASFSHQGETPGLGAEIATPAFQQQFEGKSMFRENAFTSIAVVKSGHKADGKDAVDAISGGTITSQGLEAMLLNSIGAYNTFLTSNSTESNQHENQ